MGILITLCARAGSKGIPGKNTKLLNGKPLVEYSINCAKKFSDIFNCHIAISTDDDTIKKIGESFDIHTSYKRPDNLTTDSAGKIDTITDILFFEEKLKGGKFDYVLDLDITSPIRTIQDLTTAFEILIKDEAALNIFSVNHANRNPYFNMVERKENGYYGLVKSGNFLTRQSALHVYDMNASFYFYRRSFFDQLNKKVVNEKSLIYIMQHMCFDLDHQIDFEFMSFLLEHDKLNIEL